MLRPVQKTWMTVAFLMGWVMTRALLSALFYLAITPVGFLARLFGKDFMGVRRAKKMDTFWSERDIKDAGPERYENQY